MIRAASIQFPETTTCGISEIGLKRSTNEDHFLIADFHDGSVEVCTNVPGITASNAPTELQKSILLVVADGVGGSRYGAYCSQSVIRELFNSVCRCSQSDLYSGESVESFLKSEILRIRQTLVDEGKEFPERRVMATTLTAILVIWPEWFLVHVGDSRCYLQSNDAIQQLTVDHSLTEALKARLPPEQHASVQNLKHVIWNSVSASDHHCEPDTSSGLLQHGDLLLLCTDGLTLHVEDDEIAQILSKESSEPSVCDRLTSLTLERGARDNFAVVAARFGEQG